jgi:hypothetical protein
VFLYIGFSEVSGLFGIVLAQAAFYHLVFEVGFLRFDPGSRRTAEHLYEIVPVERALARLHGVLRPDLIHPAFQAAPGLLGDAPPPRGAPRDVRPGELEEHVHVRELPVSAGEVCIPDRVPGYLPSS